MEEEEAQAEHTTDAGEEAVTSHRSEADDKYSVIEEMGEELDEFFEKSDSLTGMSAADKKKHQMEYAALLKEIEKQNRIVEEIKDQLIQMCQTPCLTKCEIKEIKKLRQCMENENLKLQCMVQRAIQMQNENPSRCWNEIPIVPTLEDDVFPRMVNKTVMEALGLMPKEKDEQEKERPVCDFCARKKKKKKPCKEEDELGSDTYKLFEEIALKDQMIDCLNQKLNMLQQEQGGQGRQGRKAERPKQPCGGEQTIEDEITNMQCTVKRLKAELKCLCKEKQQYEGQRREKPESGSKEMKKLKKSYADLLCKYSKKNDQLKELEKRVKSCSASCGGGGGMGEGKENADMAELKLLREKVNDMRDEQEEYTCIIKEQAEQIDEYRRKYIDAQQKVEEQKCMLEKIDMNNKRIEGQIEAEVKRIKAKFKEQLSELSQYPKLLENEQIKYASLCKEREDLEAKLRLVCKELKAMKDEHGSKVDKPDCSVKLAQYEGEIALLQGKLEDLEKEKQTICEELQRAKVDLDTMRSESAKIITSTKERFETNKNTMSLRIDKLEKELAQCRASAFLSIADREAVIKEMQSQLSTLSYSFDSAQKQIKTLKNHISFLSNDKCIPIKC